MLAIKAAQFVCPDSLVTPHIGITTVKSQVMPDRIFVNRRFELTVSSGLLRHRSPAAPVPAGMK